MEKITPPDGLTAHIAAALVQTGMASNASTEHVTESILYSPAMQTWLKNHAPADEEPVTARQSIPVACEVNLPLGTVTEALTVLQDVPITATLALRHPVGYDPTAPIHSESRGPHIVIRWEEHR